jgi:type II secretory pathway predicted ATPase ExeA
MSRTAMLREILSELNIPLPVGINRTQELLKLLSNHIIDLYHQGRKLVLIIDECHFLSSDNLHLVRTISNIEIPERKLTTSLLFGESRFTKRLQHPTYDSLRNRMYFRGALEAMGPEECAQYVKFRLMVAGRLDQLFTEDGLTALHARAEGVNRSVNKLGMMCLIEGASLELAELDAAHVEQCADAM